jgi:hypothetical protein
MNFARNTISKHPMKQRRLKTVTFLPLIIIILSVFSILFCTHLTNQKQVNGTDIHNESKTERSGSLSVQTNDSISSVKDSLIKDSIVIKKNTITIFVSLKKWHKVKGKVSASINKMKGIYPTDDKGCITIRDIPKDTFTLYIKSNYPDYADTSFQVIARSPDDTIQKPVSLNFTGIPPVHTLSAQSDTLSGTVTVNWKSEFLNKKNYLIFRSINNKPFSKNPVGISETPFFTDSLFSNQRKKSDALSINDTFFHHVRYCVKIKDKKNKTGISLDTVTLAVISPGYCRTIVSVTNNSKDTLSLGDTFNLQINYRNRVYPVKSIGVTTDETKQIFATDTALEGSKPVQIVFTKNGVHRILFEINDISGNKIKDSSVVTVLTDIPQVFACKDTSVGLNDTIHLRGSAKQQFGTFTQWKWLYNTDSIITQSGRDTFIIAPAKVGRMLCVLAVTDDDKNVGYDSVSISVISRPPRVKIIADSVHGFFEPIQLKTEVVDDGSVTGYEWDIGNKGIFIKTNQPDTLLTPFLSSVKNYKCRVRVIDDDGEMGVDSIFLHTSVLWRIHRTPIAERNGHTLIEFQNKLWVIGGNKDDIWNTSDGKNWSKVADSVPFGKRYGQSAIVYKDRLFIISGKVSSDSFAGDIWSTADGYSWAQDTIAPFLNRHYQSVYKFNNTLWMIGGLGQSENNPTFADIWNSEDGVHWNLITEKAPFGPRYGHGIFDFNNQLYIIGGSFDQPENSGKLNDLWKSSNGSSWVKVSTVLPFNHFHSIFAFFKFADKRLLVSDFCTGNIPENSFSDIWFSASGELWNPLRKHETECISGYFTGSLFKDLIYLTPDASTFYIMR